MKITKLSKSKDSDLGPKPVLVTYAYWNGASLLLSIIDKKNKITKWYRTSLKIYVLIL